MAREDRGRRLDQPHQASRLRRPSVDPEAFGRLSESFARFIGTARFLVYMTVFIVVWISWNALPGLPHFDPYAFLFLTLLLSLQASYAAPLILLAQNRQADRDRIQAEADRDRFERNLADTEFLIREIAAVRIAMGDVATRDYLRSELQRMLDELDERGRVSGDGRRDRKRSKPGKGTGKPSEQPIPVEVRPAAAPTGQPGPAEPAP